MRRGDSHVSGRRSFSIEPRSQRIGHFTTDKASLVLTSPVNKLLLLLNQNDTYDRQCNSG